MDVLEGRIREGSLPTTRTPGFPPPPPFLFKPLFCRGATLPAPHPLTLRQRGWQAAWRGVGMGGIRRQTNGRGGRTHTHARASTRAEGFISLVVYFLFLELFIYMWF